jgi:hypothetical protein
MSEKEIQITYNDSLAALADLLDGVKRPGDYFSARAFETPMPSLTVSGAGVVSFPVPSAQAREIVSVAAERAPYGRGDQTLVDEDVRKVWQIAPERISLGGAGWERSLRELLAQAASDLGCDPGKVAAELYKMLIYDEGGFFAAHRDTEKSPGMFGTLVVSLPSAHEGGDLVIRHAGRETVVDLRGEEAGEVRYAAFHADCEHEVRAVTKGFRVCLVYNLVHKPRSRPPKAPDHRPAVKSAAGILKKWAASGEEPLKLVYLLEHHYTQAALSFGGLKNADAARAAVLREAAALAGCTLHLGIVHIEESGWAEYTGDYHSYGRRRYSRSEDDEDEEDPSDYEIGEVCDGSYTIDQWRDTADQPVAFGEIPLGEAEVLPAGALDGEKPDKNHFSEATGNEGASFERTYLRAALVLWPEDRFDAVCVSGGVDAAIARLGQRISEANSAGRSEKEAARERARRFAGLIPLDWPDYPDHGERLASLLGHLARFKDAGLIETMAPKLFAGHYDVRQNKPLLACAKIVGPESGRDFFGGLFEAVAARHPGACMDLWRLLAGPFSEQPAVLEALLNALMNRAPEARKRPEPPKRHGYWADLGEEEDFEKLLEDSDPLSPALLSEFLAALQTALGAGECQSFLDALGANTAVFAPESLLLPCLERMGKQKADPAVTSHLWEQCASFYLRRSAAPPEKPKDWAQPASIAGSDKNPLLRELETFARDPLAREYRFRVRKDLRAELHRAIDRSGLDMTHVTDRRGSPQTLVCTKTRATHERACRQYRSDLADMGRLLALPIARTASETAARLRDALASGS